MSYQIAYQNLGWETIEDLLYDRPAPIRKSFDESCEVAQRISEDSDSVVAVIKVDPDGDLYSSNVKALFVNGLTFKPDTHFDD